MKSNLSEKVIREMNDWIYKHKDVKEKIQEAEKRIEKKIDNFEFDITKDDITLLRAEINKIFKEVFGEKLI